MSEVPPGGSALESLRRELDGIDDALLQSVLKRFHVTAQVKSFKQVMARDAGSPIRPAREAQIIRRLLARAGAEGLDAAFVLRLWRAILTQSSQEQAPITIHVGRKLAQAIGPRLRLRDHFASLPVEEWRDDAQALMQVNASPGDICVVETDGAWVEPYLAGQAGTAQVVGALPVLREEAMPKLLIIGNAPQEPTGNDETLLVSQGNLPRDFPMAPLWQVKAGPLRVSALAGFFSEHEGPLVGLARSNISLGLRVAGRYPSAIEV